MRRKKCFTYYKIELSNYFGAVNKITFFNICCGYPLQSFCSKAAKRISTSIRQPMIGLSLFNLFLGEVLRKKMRLGENIIFIAELSYKSIFL